MHRAEKISKLLPHTVITIASLGETMKREWEADCALEIISDLKLLITGMRYFNFFIKLKDYG